MDDRLFFFFNDTATTEIYTLSLHDALPISHGWRITASIGVATFLVPPESGDALLAAADRDRKSTRLKSSHSQISYAVFCLYKQSGQRPTPISHSRTLDTVTYAQTLTLTLVT